MDSCLQASPNSAHKALTHLLHPTSLAKLAPAQHVTGTLPLLVTQNVDALSTRVLEDPSLSISFTEEEKIAAKERIFEMHGNIFVTLCTDCKATKQSYDKALCDALSDPEKYADGRYDDLKIEQLPRCGGDEWKGSNRYGRCGGLLRPDVVWFGEIPKLMGDIARTLNWCDMLIVVGTSSTVRIHPFVLLMHLPVPAANHCVLHRCTQQPDSLKLFSLTTERWPFLRLSLPISTQRPSSYSSVPARRHYRKFSAYDILFSSFHAYQQ